MPLEQDFLEWFSSTVTIEPYTGQNLYGEPDYGDAVEYPALIRYRTRKVLDREGREVVSSAQVYLNGDVGIDVRDRITLPDGTSPVIISIEKYPDETGNIHHKVVNT